MYKIDCYRKQISKWLTKNTLWPVTVNFSIGITYNITS